MRSTVLIILVVAAFGHAAHGQVAEVRRGPVPAWAIPSEAMPVPENASGRVFVRRQDAVTHLDEQGAAQYIGYRIKILHANALQLGNISIAWNPASGPPIVHAVKIYRGSQSLGRVDKGDSQ